MKSSLLTTLIFGLTLATGYGFERNQDLLKQLSRSTFLRRAEPSLPMKSLLLAFRLQNEDQLFQLLNEQQNPASPLYHKWLTPEEFGDRFGAPDRIYQSAVQWLTDQGFHNIRTGASRQSIYFDGDASRVERAFAVQIGVYNYEGKKHYSNNREAVIPPQYESAVLALFLDDFDDFAPLYRGGSYDYMSPRDLRTAYNFTPLYNRGVTGKGQSIAIVARSDFDLADVQRFRSLFGLSKNDPQKVLVGTNPGNLGSDEEQEVLLDAEWAGAVAPDATVQVVISPTLDISSSVSHILNSPDLQGARIMSISF